MGTYIYAVGQIRVQETWVTPEMSRLLLDGAKNQRVIEIIAGRGSKFSKFYPDRSYSFPKDFAPTSVGFLEEVDVPLSWFTLSEMKEYIWFLEPGEIIDYAISSPFFNLMHDLERFKRVHGGEGSSDVNTRCVMWLNP